ncbi:MAG TPA: protein kinase [Pseudomonadota bacterium]|nr:protein kinase [Pseudomonadota bacterium]
MTLERVGPYQIVRQLGAGGMGLVYEGVHESIARRVAIKVLLAEFAKNPEITTRFFNEARAVNLIDHPSIVQVSDFGRLPDGTAYIVMELLKGESLAARLKQQGGRLPTDRAVQIVYQTADALAAAHARGIVHRDIKPSNIMLVGDPVAAGGERAKLLDFGIAKLSSDAPGELPKTQTGAMMGTPQYMSPEQCRGSGTVDAQSDVYSLGVMFFQLLCGRPPFWAEGTGELIGMHLYETPPPLASLAPEVPEAICELVHRMLIKDRSARPRMQEVVAALQTQLSAPSPSQLRGATAAPEPAPATMPLRSLPAPDLATLTRSPAEARSGVAATQRRDRLRVAGAATLGVLLLGLSYLTLARRSPTVATGEAPAVPTAPKDLPAEQPAPTAARAPSVPATSGRNIRWEVVSDPPGAVVLGIDGKKLGTTPWQTSRAAQSGTFVVRLRKPGYQRKTLTLNLNQDDSRQEVLAPLPRGARGKSEGIYIDD